jgi:hypothetical protein
MSDPAQGRREAAPIAECRLDPSGLRDQRRRYRTLGRHVTAVARRPCALEIRLGPNLDERLLDETLAVERECCPFFRFDYHSAHHLLSVSVDPEHEPALDAITHALEPGRTGAGK